MKRNGERRAARSMTITYQVRNGIYVNMTNRCPCACTFCLRANGEGVYGSDSLWLEREPSVEEVCQSLGEWDLNQYEEVVFCGYGEPTERLPELLEVAEFIKENYDVKTRINTNGLADLIWDKPTASLLSGVIDAVSISLNTDDPQEYLDVVRPKFGEKSYEAMKKFTADCSKYVPTVVMTVVDKVTSPAQQERCRKIAEDLGASLRVRAYEE